MTASWSRDECLRCSETSFNHPFMVEGDGHLCGPCCALVDPERVIGEWGEEGLADLLSKAERSDEEWEELGWRPQADGDQRERRALMEEARIEGTAIWWQEDSEDVFGSDAQEVNVQVAYEEDTIRIDGLRPGRYLSLNLSTIAEAIVAGARK